METDMQGLPGMKKISRKDSMGGGLLTGSFCVIWRRQAPEIAMLCFPSSRQDAE